MRSKFYCARCEKQFRHYSEVAIGNRLTCWPCAHFEMEARERLQLAEWRTDHSEECCCLSCCQKRTAA